MYGLNVIESMTGHLSNIDEINRVYNSDRPGVTMHPAHPEK